MHTLAYRTPNKYEKKRKCTKAIRAHYTLTEYVAGVN